MTASSMKTADQRAPPASFIEPVPRLFWTQEQAADRLGISVRSFFELRASHEFYAPDGSRCLAENPKRDMPLWSDDLIRLIAFARSLTAQKVRQLSDSEGIAIRRAMEESKRRQYLSLMSETPPA